MIKIDKKKRNRGFVLVVSIILLVAMSIMGVVLVAMVSNEFKENDRRDEYQQALYAAESAVNVAKTDLANRLKNGMPSATVTPTLVNWCNASKFRILRANTPITTVNSPSITSFSIKLQGTDVEGSNKKYQNFSYYYFVTNTPDIDGTVSKIKIKTGTVRGGSAGSSVAQGTSYKSQSTGSSNFYTIFACGANNDRSIVVPLDVTVSLKK
jgi:Tfp pilus assembly protein PilX